MRLNGIGDGNHHGISLWARLAALLMFVLVLLWAGWLWRMRQTKLDYILEAARAAAPIPMCKWVPVDDPDIASLGLSKKTLPAWTDSNEALVAFRTAQGQPWYVDLGVVAVAGDGVTVSADGGAPRAIARMPYPRGLTMRLPLSLRADHAMHVITIKVAAAKPPSGREERWLGVAVGRIRACNDLSPWRR